MDDMSSEESLGPGELETWARKHGYEMALRRRGRRNIFQTLGEMQTKKPVTPPPTRAGTGPLDVDLRQMTITRALKGDRDKKTMLIKVGNKDFVLKGAEGTPVPHVKASEFLGKLGLKGVKVPQVRLLSDSEKTELVNSLAQGDQDAKELANALKLGSGQLSELVEGKPLDQVFLSREENDGLKFVLQAREDLDKDKPGKDEAWNRVAAKLLEATKNSSGFKKPPGYDGWFTSNDPATRQTALAFWAQNFYKAKQLELVKLLGEIEGGADLGAALQKAKTALEQRQKAMGPLKDFAGSPEGVEAFAGVAVGDLITGMDDRVLSKWNGGNFLFDEKSGSLCCIDNVKNTDRGPTAGDERSWQQFFSDNSMDDKPLGEILFDSIYGKTLIDEQAPGGFVELDDEAVAQGKETFKRVLEDVVAKVESDPNAGSPMRERAAFIKARLVVDETARLPDHLLTPPALPAKLDVGQKISRGLGSMFTSNKKDKRNDTKKIKDDLRAGKITAAQARTQLEALVNSKPGVGNDRRTAKIRFLAGLSEMCELLEERAAALATLSTQNPPPSIWSTLGPRTEALRGAVIAWDAVAAKESKLRPRLVQAWNSLPDEVRNGG